MRLVALLALLASSLTSHADARFQWPFNGGTKYFTLQGGETINIPTTLDTLTLTEDLGRVRVLFSRGGKAAKYPMTPVGHLLSYLILRVTIDGHNEAVIVGSAEARLFKSGEGESVQYLIETTSDRGVTRTIHDDKGEIVPVFNNH